MNKKLNIKIILIIVTISTLLGLMYNAFSADGIKLIRKPIKIKTVDIISNNDSSEVIKSLNLSQVLNLYNTKIAKFIDARDQWDFSEKHITGAINIPEFSFSPNNKILDKLKKDDLIIVYCDGDDCDISKRLAVELIKLGFINSYVFLGGITEWENAELPIEVGEAL